MVYSIGDVSLELNAQYTEALRKKETFKKGERSRIFLSILSRLFEEYGQLFGCDTLSAFRSEIIECKNRIKRSKNIFAQKNSKKHFDESPLEIEPVFKFETISVDSSVHKREESGESFTIEQVKYLGLNPESY